MTRRRFYAPPDAFSSNHERVTLAADEARHLRDVLRLKSGDEVYVFDGLGREFQCTVINSGRDAAQLNIISEAEPSRPESPLQLTLAVALLKGEKFDLVTQKASELGVRRIVPMITKHADIQLRDGMDADKRVQRWRRIALEAAKQSGRARVTEVSSPVPFDALVNAAELQNQQKLLFSEREGLSFSEIPNKIPASIIAAVGSEGGWSDEEITLAREHGWTVITLSGRTLRAETAAITAAVLLQHTFGDLR